MKKKLFDAMIDGFVEAKKYRAKKLKSIHPGEMLREEFMKPANLSVGKLARALKVKPKTIRDILRGHLCPSSDLCRRLGEYFGTSTEMWMNFNASYRRGVEDWRSSKLVEIDKRLKDLEQKQDSESKCVDFKELKRLMSSMGPFNFMKKSD